MKESNQYEDENNLDQDRKENDDTRTKEAVNGKASNGSLEKKIYSKHVPSNSEGESQQYTNGFIEELSDILDSVKADFQKTIDGKIDQWKDHHLKYKSVQSKLGFKLSDGKSKKSASQKTEVIPSHVFTPRESLLNELLEIDHIKGIYNILMATLIILCMGELLEGIVHDGSVNVDISLILYSFGKPASMFTVWAGMKLSTIFIVYGAFSVWAKMRHFSPAFYDTLAGVFFALYMTLFFYLPVTGLLRFQLPPTSSFIILCEQTRLVMKTWGFVRSNIPRAMQKKRNKEHDGCPKFSCYLYYLFAPTLVYRDQYPRSKGCNWLNVAQDLMHVVGCIIFANFLFTRFCLPTVQKFGKEEFTMSRLMISIFSCCFPGSLLFLLGFFMFLHSWMNAFAEILTFSDRMFYKDWWNSTSYARFYRTWNCVVHDFLYEYVYKDVAELYVKRGFSMTTGRKVSKLLVFFISALVHEYILAFSLRFYYPVLLVLFGGFGVVLSFINLRSERFNIFLWFSLILGMGILVCLYFLEWYARINCPPITDGFTDLLIPRSWFCNI